MNKALKGRIVTRFGNQFLFSQAIGEHEAIVSKVVREKLNLDLAKQKIWAEALGVRREEIFNGNGHD